MSKLSDYEITEQIHANPSTLIQRAVRLCDQQSVILRSINNPYPTTKQLSRFTYSYELLKRFAHLNVIRVLDWIETDKSPVMVLEDQHAIDLRQYRLQQTNQQLSIEQFILIATQLADALSEMHHQRVIHKDLHPGNILINPENGVVQVIDFGLSSLLSREQPALKPPDQIEGVLDYISPEQTGRMNRGLDCRSDYYSLGVTFYELLTGQLPFSGEDILATVHNHIAKQQEQILTIRHNAPQALSEIIDKLMAKSAEDRYQSALGLKYDLEKVFEYWQHGNNLTFELGSKDIAEKFYIPQRLYGREHELFFLFNQYQQAVSGQPQIVAVAGYAGIGKSSLINELHKPIAEKKGLFLSGKFEQYAQSSPYTAIKQAFRTWLRYTLALQLGDLHQLQDKLRLTLSDNAKILVDFLPELEKVLGEQPKVPDLAPLENQNRLNLALCQFVRGISLANPLVLFIDDLQWADFGTLSLLQNLMQEDTGHFLILLAYRENHVDHAHPTKLALKQIKQLQTLNLHVLSENVVGQLLSDILHQPRGNLAELSDVVQQHTAGNPFYLKAFLKQLYQADMLYFDLKQTCWCWDIEQIKTKAVSDNVVELLLQQIKALPEKSRRILHIAACLGTWFDLTRLSIAADESMSECARLLLPVLEAGFIQQESGDWSLGMAGVIDLNPIFLNSYKGFQAPKCRFSHDRVLQAAYNFFDDDSLKQTHLDIGRRLLAHYDEDERQRNIFSLLKHLNEGRTLITQPEERLLLAELNEHAAQKNKSAGVWEVAGTYAEIGQELLPPDAWSQHYQLSFNLKLINAECSALAGQLEKTEALYRQLMIEAQSELEKAQLCLNQLILFFGLGKWEQAIAIGEKGLNYCGLSISETKQGFELALTEIENQLAQHLSDTPISKINQLPEMQSPIKQVTMGLLGNLGTCNMVIGKSQLLKLCVKQALVLTFKHGKTDLSALTLAIYALLKATDEQYEQAIEAAEQALDIMASYPNCRETSNILNILSTTVLHYQKPLQQVRKLHQQGYQKGLLSGEFLRAVINLNNELHIQFCQGDKLNKLKQAAKNAINVTESNKQTYPVSLFWLKLSKSLMESGSYYLDEADLDSKLLESVRNSIHFAHLNHVRMQYTFWSNGPIPERLTSIQQAAFTLTGLSSTVLSVDHHLISGLTLIEALAEAPYSAKAQEYSDSLLISLNKIKKLTELCPANFAHKHYLLEAEKLRLQECSPWKAMPYYQQAINSAKEQGFLQYQALANELCGTFCLRQHNPTMAAIYLREALYLYEKWGCTVRVNDLQNQHSVLLQKAELKNNNPTNVSLQVSVSSQYLVGSEQALDKPSLDLNVVTQASQVISREVQMDKLLSTIINTILTHSGAQIGALVLNRRLVNHENSPTVEAYQNSLSGEREFLEAKCLDASLKLPSILIQSVLLCDEGLILTIGEDNEQNDPYLQVHQPKSLLCMPIDHHKGIVGALYLEHRSQSGLFTADIIELISLLMAQAAISLENAHLFSNIQKLTTKLEDKVQARSIELKSANKELHHLATRDSLTGMFNRRHFIDCGEAEFDTAQKTKSSLAVMIMDIDHFKQVNDNYGHPAGDKVLIAVTQLCQSLLRAGDILGRIGGEEFGVLLANTTEKEALDWTQNLVDSIRPIEVESEKGIIQITMSVGLCCQKYPHMLSLNETLQRADEALYEAKEGGRDQVCVDSRPQ